MAPKKRSRKNSDLTGTNIVPKVRKKGTEGEYIEYRYMMPETLPNGSAPDSRSKVLGTIRKDAIEAALQLNSVLRPSGDIVDRVLLSNRSKPAIPLDNMNKLITEFIEHYLPEQGYQQSTLTGKLIKLRTYGKYWGDTSSADITTADIVEFLNQLTTNAYIKHKATLMQLFTFAIHQGYRETNPVTVTMTKTAPKKARKEHTLEGWNTIRAHAEPWLQRAMDIALLSLQRRSDLTSLHTRQVNLQNRTIEILQEKTRNYARPVYIEIQMGDELFEAVKGCYQTGILCPYLIHYKPKKMSRADQNAKKHSFAVTPQHLTKTFSKVRDSCGAYDHLPKSIRPSLHGARGLGAFLYEKAGYSEQYIMALTGHTDVKMLRHYIDGHEAPKPVKVAAGLSVKGIIR